MSFTEIIPLVEKATILVSAIVAGYLFLRIEINNLKESNRNHKEDLIKQEKQIATLTATLYSMEKDFNSKLAAINKSFASFEGTLKEVQSNVRHATESFNHINRGIATLLEKLDNKLEDSVKDIYKELKGKQDK